LDQPLPETAARPALSHVEIRRIILGIMLGMLLAALDQTIVAPALPTIGRELGGFDQISWIVTAYLLASTAATPLYGKISDAHGRRITFLAAIAIFVVGSVACALATSLPFLAAARFLQGLGGGGLMSLAQIVIADIVAPRERGRYQVYIASTFVASSLAGPVLGGFLAEHLHWSAIFWINLPLGLVALVSVDRTLRLLPQNHRRHSLDLVGAALMALATSSLLLALSWGGARHPWNSAPVLGLFAASALLWLAFAVRTVTAREPLIPLTVLRNGVVRSATLAACFGMGTYIGLSIFVPLYFEAVFGLPASQTGVAVIPLMVGTVIGSIASGRAMANLTHYKRVPLAGVSASVACAVLLALMPDRLPLAAVEVVLALLSVGLGTLFPVSTVSIQNAVDRHEIGTATAVANFFRALGGALLVAVFGAIIVGGSGTALDLGALHGGGLGGADARALAPVFGWVFAAAALGFVGALGCLAAMRELPLRSGAASPASAVAD
jgi:EmrB/QacA subfamily drug resistance transporter